MVAAVRGAARGDAMISPRITRRLLRKFAEPAPNGAATASDGSLCSPTRNVRYWSPSAAVCRI